MRGLFAVAGVMFLALSSLKCLASQDARVPPTEPSGAGVLARITGPVTPKDISAVLLAIKDEIYAGRCAPAFADIGKPVGPGEKIHQINVYFELSVRQGLSSVVYKFWPFGEVDRMYWIDKAGVAHLAGHADWGFPPTEPSYLTIYMGDRELCRLKSDWKRVPLDIKISPSLQRIREAEQRQAKRGGDVNVCQGQWHGNIFIPHQPTP